MALITTKAIVLRAIKYGDTSLIVTCFTLESGIVSYLIRGVLKSRKGTLKKAYFQPLTQLLIQAKHHQNRNKNALSSMKEAQVIYPYTHIHTSVVKQSIVLFLSEILTNIIKEEEKNDVLYQYIETSLIWLDTHSDVANFHLLFLLNLSKFLGFYPDVSQANKPAFSLSEGRFTTATYEKLVLTGNELLLFKKLLGINFDAIHTISYHKNERQTILGVIIRYFELHLEGFKKPKSLAILETVFS
ncbi:DNA repair protein RecO [Tenacibaculum finnmarkense]|uniref:DNA repair protein RecO n=1 Tax=Tenacibaculum finnmarkense TaxID=2781243 RepID=UPI001E55B271|nr:DNA repair protein RecO [Tenacibaculum finnmarkense]MCD8412925.1 DNA repair protein RecO [Tenacibaculum finnmarkense genomovar ulcerans]MCG8205962.1 DNA repair protein RecO [Tenacibaculum finnmarkense genomovar finnmarkense]MCG8721967.1 DNA repair protein RecO [Tenacibaculum finnmarkense]MCG8740345.1 DNA repair protein RecO [Tenacibaculum finnmarkense]MCG8763679.1 DNA repair protein RecO [Tenacibaculum finnmarkense]